jgi:hypothetical protein
VNEIAMREGEKGIDTFEPFNPEYPKHNINTTFRRAERERERVYRRYPREISLDSVSIVG